MVVINATAFRRAKTSEKVMETQCQATKSQNARQSRTFSWRIGFTNLYEKSKNKISGKCAEAFFCTLETRKSFQKT
jgi:hypothetical protein